MTARGKIALAAVLGVALGLRLWGVAFGLPHLYHYDEHFYVNTALKLGTGVLHNPPFAPTGLSNVLVIEYGAYYLVGRLAGLFASAETFEALFRTNPTSFYLLARITSAPFGMLGVLAVYVLGRVRSGGRLGALAAAFLAVSLLAVRDAHYAVPDIPMSTLVIVAVALSAVAVRSGRAGLLNLAGLSAGLAVAMKWTALPVLLPVILAGLWSESPAKFVTASRPWRRLLTSALCVVFGFSLGAWQILLSPAPYVREALGQHGAGQSGGFEIWQVDRVSGWVFYLKTLNEGLGPIMLGLAILGMGRRIVSAVRYRDRQSVLLVAFPLLYYLAMGSTRHYFTRYTLPLLAFACLFAAQGMLWISGLLAKRMSSARSWLPALLALAAMLQPTIESVRSDWLLAQTDTRTLAKAWIETHIPSGARIAVDWPVHGPPLATAEQSAARAEAVYEVVAIGGSGLSEHDVDWYRDQGFDYLISSSFIYEIPLIDPERNRARDAFYASLADEFEEVQAFRPGAHDPPFVFDEIYGPLVSLWQRERPGPVLRIYRVNEEPQ